jgi:His/Glu/Gln/Arg/opine family amino acid ABC transporter permease subunit
MGYQWRFDIVWKHINFILGGLGVTFAVSGIGLAIAIVVGLVVAMLRMFRSRLLNIPLLVYQEFFRTTPPLVQLVWVYYCIPVLGGFELSAFWAGTLTLALNTGAFLGEVFRAGIEGVAKGQREAAQVLGMSYFQTMRRIVLPQAFIRMLPPLGSELIKTIKFSSLVSVIAVSDLLHRAQLMSAITYRPLEFLTVVAVIYFLITYPISPIVLLLEKRAGIGEHM